MNMVVIDDAIEAFGHPRFIHLGFDQVACGSNWMGFKRKAMKVDAGEVMGLVVKFVREHADSDRMLGYMMAPWARCSNDETIEKNMRARASSPRR